MDLSVALNKRGYLPGEVVKILVKATRTGGAAAAALGADGGGGDGGSAQLTLECGGAEKVDPGWVQSLYQPQVPAQKDTKRLVRAVFATGQLPLYDGDDWPPGTTRAFTVSFRLPGRIPPSFRGSAVHFVYSATARATVTPAAAGKPATPVATQAFAPFVVWPKPERPAGAGASLDGRRSSLHHAGSLDGGGGAGSLPRASSAGSPQAAGGAGGAAFAAAAGAEGPAEQAFEPDVLEYRLGVGDVKAVWEEVAIAGDGSLQRLPSGSPPGAAASGSGGPPDGGEGAAAAAATAAEAAEAEDGLRNGAAAAAAAGRLTAAQRASMLPRTFHLRAGDHPLARVTLQPPMDTPLQPGATLGVFLDLSAAHAGGGGGGGGGEGGGPACLQVSALLQSEEEVHPPFARRGAAKPAPGGGPGGVCAMRVLHSEQSQVTAHLLTGQFTLSVPPNAHPSFRTPLVTHRWTLRFELTLGSAVRGGPKGVEQLVWTVPLLVCPPVGA
ncbi:hypothetical protein Rsub_06637 [Raphidocelis subcapitata]|uniref:Arrestin-like N-terminal domain-containing protein n=1 Tax=Raphidocelis subcapitata TaxID=307507 RepID=A0A2V0P0W7_9CHLO|nr:hypothetical protein Rsub_06637 [Raphidocelis subcapitata]|eukprot:GBF93504.1 hypothetical protein Rsub_06637 [Raphidocelis subcapitata]